MIAITAVYEQFQNYSYRCYAGLWGSCAPVEDW